LYTQPIPDGYIPLTVSVEPNLYFDVAEFKYPESNKKTITSLQETFEILPEKMRLKTFLRIKRKPTEGEYKVSIKIAFQACNDNSCMLPEEFNFDFPLTIG
jgi:preprotein translocase subunit Sss1